MVDGLLWTKIIGLIVILSSFIWMIYRKKYDIAIALFFVAVTYALLVFIPKG